MTKSIGTLALIALFALAGCATAPQEREPDEPDEMADEPADDDAAATAAAADCPPSCDFGRGAIDDPDGMLADRTIYFEFDSSEVQQEYMDIVERHAAYLAQYPDADVRLEGHTDERGSREYNIGLGERRAGSVQDLLQVHGTGSDQVETVSYGEEMPAADGHGEAAWSENRRVELVYSTDGS